jgi:adenylate kinase
MKLVFFGPPGVGKGTAAARLSKEKNIPHISTGELFREAVKNQTELGKKVQSIIDAGALVPDTVTIELVRDRLSKADIETGYILDGFPRTLEQAEALSGMCSLCKVVNLVADDSIIIERLSGRRVCRAQGHTFHVTYMAPKEEGICDICGSELYQRKDDSKEAVQERLDVYRKQTKPLINYYRNHGILLDIDASPSPDEVYGSVVAKL